MQHKGFRLFLAIVVILILAAVSLFAMLLFSFSVGSDFYLPVILIVFIALSVWIILFAVSSLPRKTIWLILGIIALGTVLPVSIYEGRRSYINSIPVVDDQGVNLRDYQPFSSGSKVAMLDEEATFRIQDSIPSLDGATALYPLYSAFVQATFPEANYNPYGEKVTSNTTPEAYDHLLSGDADLIFCAAPSEAQRMDAKRLGKELKMIPIGKEAFVFFVNAKNPVSELTVEQIQDIYSGIITNWKEVGGKDEEIRAFQRPRGSGSQTMLEKIMEGKPLMNPPLENRVRGMGGIIESTSRYKNFGNAIGYTFLYFATEMIGNNGIKLLRINGVQPDRAAIEDNSYPFTGDFYAIATDSENPNLDGFIQWILSPQGQKLVEKTGYTPLYPAH